MAPDPAKGWRLDGFDITKVWPHKDFRQIGAATISRSGAEDSSCE